MVHIHNAILLSDKKEHIWVSPGEADEHRAYYTEGSKSEKNKYRLLKHIHGIEKDVTDEPVCRAAMGMQT